MAAPQTIRVLIVDDEEPARRLLREYLADAPGVIVVGDCANGFEAVKAAGETGADLLLLDVQMPKLDGFEVLELLDREVPVIFVTAYDEFSIRAFDVHAVDYLLKPFSRERLLEALERARDRIGLLRSRADRPRELPETKAAREIRAHAAPLERLLVREGARVHVIPVRTILYIEAQDDYVNVVTRKERLLKQQTLNELEGLLDPGKFVRVHRSYIINVEALVRIEPLSKDTRGARLADGTEVPVSRGGFERLRRLM